MDIEQIYINGEWTPSTGSESISVVDPTTETIYATVPAGSPDDVARAVAAAKEALGEWGATPAPERAKKLRFVAAALDTNRNEIAEVISHEVGMPKPLSASMQVGAGISTFNGAAAVLDTFNFEDRTNGLVVFDPVGVVACITPWNFPLNQIGAKVAYALAAGCTAVLKPSEVAPVNAFRLAEIIHDAGFPPGVFNLVMGDGPLVGEALAAHPDVDMVSFTGSTRAGRRVAELAAPTIKRVALELGGKSPNVILNDADFDTVVPAGVGSAFINSGQACSALTRMLVPRAEQDRIVAIARKAAESYVVGNPFESGTTLGPLVSALQRQRVRKYIVSGQTEGARLVTGGPEAPTELPVGYFVRPTVFADVTSDMTIAEEEIFGPVLCILPYESDDEAIAIANATPYGLSGAVYGDPTRAERIARKIRAGTVQVNQGVRPTGVPSGGVKQSGLGREHGIYGLKEFLEPKAVFI